MCVDEQSTSNHNIALHTHFHFSIFVGSGTIFCTPCFDMFWRIPLWFLRPPGHGLHHAGGLCPWGTQQAGVSWRALGNHWAGDLQPHVMHVTWADRWVQHRSTVEEGPKHEALSWDPMGTTTSVCNIKHSTTTKLGDDPFLESSILVDPYDQSIKLHPRPKVIMRHKMWFCFFWIVFSGMFSSVFFKEIIQHETLLCASMSCRRHPRCADHFKDTGVVQLHHIAPSNGAE